MRLQHFHILPGEPSSESSDSTIKFRVYSRIDQSFAHTVYGLAFGAAGIQDVAVINLTHGHHLIPENLVIKNSCLYYLNQAIQLYF